MITDGHIHITDGCQDRSAFRARLGEAGVSGGIVISIAPKSFGGMACLQDNAERLRNLMAWIQDTEALYPFYWIDPTEEDAGEQVRAAVQGGVAGFKVICDHFYPRDERAMRVFQAVAAARKPILFHSGILWDGKDSARFNRPGEFEALLDVNGLRFCLAHISWPWCDELVAVYGKFLNAYTRKEDLSVEMFVDTTPGTPPIYREETFRKLFFSEYDVGHNVIFGSDCRVSDYNVSWVRQWVARDTEILRKLGVDSEIQSGVFGRNVRRFVGTDDEYGPTVRRSTVERRLPRPAE